MFVRSTLSGLPLAPEGRRRAQVALIHLAAFGMRSNESTTRHFPSFSSESINIISIFKNDSIRLE